MVPNKRTVENTIAEREFNFYDKPPSGWANEVFDAFGNAPSDELFQTKERLKKDEKFRKTTEEVCKSTLRIKDNEATPSQLALVC